MVSNVPFETLYLTDVRHFPTCRDFLNCVRSIKILSPSEVTQISQDQLKMLETVPVQHLQPQRLISSDSGEVYPQSSLPDPSSGL